MSHEKRNYIQAYYHIGHIWVSKEDKKADKWV